MSGTTQERAGCLQSRRRVSTPMANNIHLNLIVDTYGIQIFDFRMAPCLPRKNKLLISSHILLDTLPTVKLPNMQLCLLFRERDWSYKEIQQTL